jgi:hypothetical protein
VGVVLSSGFKRIRRGSGTYLQKFNGTIKLQMTFKVKRNDAGVRRLRQNAVQKLKGSKSDGLASVVGRTERRRVRTNRSGLFKGVQWRSDIGTGNNDVASRGAEDNTELVSTRLTKVSSVHLSKKCFVVRVSIGNSRIRRLSSQSGNGNPSMGNHLEANRGEGGLSGQFATDFRERRGGDDNKVGRITTTVFASRALDQSIKAGRRLTKEAAEAVNRNSTRSAFQMIGECRTR